MSEEKEQEPNYIELTPDEMVEQARKRTHLVPHTMALIMATLDAAMVTDQLLKLMALSSATIQIGIEMGLDHDLFMQLMAEGWTVMKTEEVNEACQEAKRELRSQ